MLKAIANQTTELLIRNHIIDEKNAPIYLYGFQLLYSFLFGTGIIVLSGCVFGILIETFLFLLVFIPFRSYTGGYHANTYLKCTIFTLLSYSFVILSSAFLPVKLSMYLILLGVGLLLLIWFAPIQHPNKKLSIRKQKKCKIISITLFVLLCGIGCFLQRYMTRMGSIVFYTLLVDMILFIIPMIMKGGKSHDKTV